MCLTKDEQNTKQYAKTICQKGGKIIGWKALIIYNGQLQSAIYSHIWNSGWNKSGRNGLEDSSDYIFLNGDCEINRGIHIYKRRPRKDPGQKIIPVVCYLEDFVASSKNPAEAVFVKVFLRKKDYLKAMKGS